MTIIGRVEKEEGIWWSAHCDIAGVFTQGKSKADAMKQLAAAFEDVADAKGFKVTVVDRGDGEVLIEANDPGALLAIVLRYQREVSKLSLADVASKLGVTSRNAYARYEQGAAMPKLDTVCQLLAAVAPNVCLAFIERVPPKVLEKTTSNGPSDLELAAMALAHEIARSADAPLTKDELELKVIDAVFRPSSASYSILDELNKEIAGSSAAEPRSAYVPSSGKGKSRSAAKDKAAR